MCLKRFIYIQAEIWNIGMVVRDCGCGLVQREQVSTGYQLMEQHSAPITDAAFSPDGTALATAALDGYVKFFQVGGGDGCMVRGRFFA